jgi:hypothetical protein
VFGGLTARKVNVQWSIKTWYRFLLFNNLTSVWRMPTLLRTETANDTKESRQIPFVSCSDCKTACYEAVATQGAHNDKTDQGCEDKSCCFAEQVLDCRLK